MSWCHASHCTAQGARAGSQHARAHGRHAHESESAPAGRRTCLHCTNTVPRSYARGLISRELRAPQASQVNVH